jgi:hypothetical protein
MKTQILTSTLTLLVLWTALPSCGEGEAKRQELSQSQAQAAPRAPAAAPSEPDPKLLLTRVRERWNFVTNQDWIQAYDFFSPARKRVERLTGFLGGKEYHEYGEASKPVLVAIEENLGYVELTVDWTPHHPELLTAANLDEAPAGLTQTLHMIETWEWVDGQWYYRGAERRNEFFDAHPRLARKN